MIPARNGAIFLVIGTVALLAITTDIVQVGPCTEGLGAFCLFTVLFCFPVGAACLTVAGIRFLRAKRLNNTTFPRCLPLSFSRAAL